MQEINSGVIFTRSNCIGCNKCISGCIAVGANVVVRDQKSGRNVVLVDQNKCILCGSCIEACVHHARSYHDDTDAFFRDLKAGKEISILVSPTLLINYENQYNNILGYLKHLGVRHIFSTGFGGDIMIWVYMNFIRDFGLSGVISQFCPVIVNYLEKYKPEMLQYLMPVQTPMMCTAIYVSDYLKITDKLAYISPCIASKHEISDVNTYERVSYNVTFERLMERLEGVDLSDYSTVDEARFGLGGLIPMAGGLSDNMERYIGFDKVLIQTTGPSNIFPYFDHYNKVVMHQGQLPFLVEALCCTYGCNFGTGTTCGVELRNEMTFSAHRVKEAAYRNGLESGAHSYIERLQRLNSRFAEFELSSFVRQYDVTRSVTSQVLTEDEYDQVFRSLYKLDEEQRHTDCGSCGYTTCRSMAYAIGINANNPENCINYAKECIRLETEKTNKLLQEISEMNEELRKTTQMKSNFLANMSHEIRTPMNAIIGMAEMALRGNLPAEERSYLQQIKSSGRSLLAIINDILDFSKIESGKMELNEVAYNPVTVVSDTVNIITTRIGEKDIALLVDADPGVPKLLYGDDIRIKQVLVNFANNAVKFTQSGFVQITLGQERVGSSVYITGAIQDTGIGIREEDLEKLFNSFQQVDSKRTRNVEGTGLGLAIAKEFVEMMGGEINVESVYGEGSTFSFRIPQKIENNLPAGTVKREGTVKTASFFGNHYVELGYRKAISYFDIEDTRCESLEELKAAQQAGAEFLFVDYGNWTPDCEAFANLQTQSDLVLIVDPRKEIIFNSNVRKMNLPIYSFGIAAVLNRETIDYYDQEDQSQEVRFEAPDARILIVDDNAINLTVAKGLLSPLRMKLTGVSGALEAVRLLENIQFDIVFMDHMMPDIDGVEATHMIREMEGDYYKNVPIIALTANAINNAREMFLREGMNDFVAKPIEMSDISAKIKRWLPPEKIRVIPSDASGESADCPENPSVQGPAESSMLKELRALAELNVTAGLGLAGSEQLYLSILKEYYSVIQKKADLIETYEREDNIPAYTIEVHALKSASRMIGAEELADMAARLEACGHEGQLEPIRQETAELLRRYRSYASLLAPWFGGPQQEASEHFELEELYRLLQELQAALDDFDLDRSLELMGALERALMEGDDLEARERLKAAVDDMEYDVAAQLAAQWKERIE